MYGHYVFLVLLQAALRGSRAAPDCRALGYGDTEPTSAANANLAVCTDVTQQCCTSFFETYFLRNPVQLELERFLTTEYQNGLNNILGKIDGLISYFHINFTDDILDALPFGSICTTLSFSSRNLMDSLYGNSQSDICSIFPTHIEDIVDKFSNELGGNERECVYRTTCALINGETVDRVSSNLVKLSRILKGLQEISLFVRTQENRTQGARVGSQCIDGFVRAALCQQCIELTPPLCLSTCNALLRGCYSPYYTVLNQQFSRLWTEVGRVVSIATATVTSMISDTRNIIDFPKLVSEIQSQCKISSDFSGGIPQRGSDGIPPNLVAGLTSLIGPFQYGSSDLQFCQFYLRLNACTIEEPTQLKNDTYTCNPGEICTSECDCFDGVDFTLNTETTRVFNKSTVNDQDVNPAYIQPLNITELTREVSMLNGSDPIANFLESYSKVQILLNFTMRCSMQEDFTGDNCRTVTGTTTTDGGTRVHNSSPLFVQGILCLIYFCIISVLL